LLGEISTGARHQEDDIDQVNRAIQQIDGFTQQNAAMVEQLAASAQALGGQVDGVNHSMRLFRLDAGERTLADADAVALRRAARAVPD
jgi:aerotaxis receptor